MSANRLTLAAPGNCGHGNHSGTSSPHHDQNDSRRSGVPLPLFFRSEEESYFTPWRLFEERVRSGPFGLTRFPLEPLSPIRILVLDGGAGERVTPGLRHFIRSNTPPRIRGEWHLGLSQEHQEPRLTDEEFKKAMKKLKKQVYVPPYVKTRAQRKGLSSYWSSKDNTKEAGEEMNDKGKECAICLEAFVLNEQVLVTPCNHMFHYDCLVPWVKSHGQCPVCRFALCGKGETASVPNNNMTNSGRADLALDFIALMRAMEEAFNWINHL